MLDSVIAKKICFRKNVLEEIMSNEESQKHKSAKLLVQGNSSDKNMCYGRSEEGENIVHSGGRVGGYVEEEGLRGWF